LKILCYQKKKAAHAFGGGRQLIMRVLSSEFLFTLYKRKCRKKLRDILKIF
jgi:hypothetical protein